MKTLTLSLALTFALLAASTASAAVSVHVGSVRFAVRRPLFSRVYVAPTSTVLVTPRIIPRSTTYYRYHYNPYWDIRQHELDTLLDIQQQRLDMLLDIRRQQREAIRDTIAP